MGRSGLRWRSLLGLIKGLEQVGGVITWGGHTLSQDLQTRMLACLADIVQVCFRSRQNSGGESVCGLKSGKVFEYSSLNRTLLFSPVTSHGTVVAGSISGCIGL